MARENKSQFNLPPPKIRTSKLKDHVSLLLKAGSRITITPREVPGTATLVGTTFKTLAENVEQGSRILLSDGLIELRVHEVDGGKKDSVVNVEATGEFVYNMATWAQKDQMNETARIVERGVDEMAAVGLEPLPSRLVRPPRVKGSPVQFECRLHQVVVLPGRIPSSVHHVVIGRVVAVHIDDEALTKDGRVDVVKLRPIARLGYKDYACVDSVFQMEKRMPEDLLNS